MAHICKFHDMSQDHKNRLEALLIKIQEAGQSCQENLQKVLRERSKIAKAAYTWKWMETCTDFITYLAKSVGAEGWKTGLHISNLREENLDQFGDFMLPLAEATRIYKQLHSAGAVVANELENMGHKKLVLWAPTNSNVFRSHFGSR